MLKKLWKKLFGNRRSKKYNCGQFGHLTQEQIDKLMPAMKYLEKFGGMGSGSKTNG